MIREAIGVGETEVLALEDAKRQLGIDESEIVEFEGIKSSPLFFCSVRFSVLNFFAVLKSSDCAISFLKYFSLANLSSRSLPILG